MEPLKEAMDTIFNLGFYPAGFSAGTPYASLVKELDFPQLLLRLGVSSKDKQKHYTARCLVITVNCLANLKEGRASPAA
jgi:hypothetical protein